MSNRILKTECLLHADTSCCFIPFRKFLLVILGLGRLTPWSLFFLHQPKFQYECEPNIYYYIVLAIDVSFIVVADENRAHRVDRDASSMENQRGGRFYCSSSVLPGTFSMELANVIYFFYSKDTFTCCKLGEER